LSSLAATLGVGTMTLRGVLSALAAPAGVDDRTAADPVSLLRISAVSAAHLKPGDVLEGVVRNVVPFGAFVDIGVGTAGLLHRSKMNVIGDGGSGGGGGGVKEMHDLLSAGQAVSVMIECVDMPRNRIGLLLA